MLASVIHQGEQNQTGVSDSVFCYLNRKQPDYQTETCLFKTQYIFKDCISKRIYEQVSLDIVWVKVYENGNKEIGINQKQVPVFSGSQPS